MAACLGAPAVTRPRRRLLLGLGVAGLLGLLPKAVAEADLGPGGPWRFVVSAQSMVDFREEYDFRSRRACEEERAAMGQGFARVAADQGGGTAAGRGSRGRLRLGPCEAVRRPR